MFLYILFLFWLGVIGLKRYLSPAFLRLSMKLDLYVLDGRQILELEVLAPEAEVLLTLARRVAVHSLVQLQLAEIPAEQVHLLTSATTFIQQKNTFLLYGTKYIRHS